MDTSQGEFFVGATLLGHAVEGGNFASDWWRWEQRPGHIRGNDTSQQAAGHFERYAEDLALAARLRLNALLIAVEWSRIQPDENSFDEDALAHYREVLKGARGHGITPFVALHHVAVPQWFAAGYSWGHSRAPELFARYVRRALEAFGCECRHWIPWHESMYWFVNAGVERRWPSGPGLWKFPRTLRNMRAVHAAAYAAIKAMDQDAHVGHTVRVRRFLPRNPGSLWDQRAAGRATRFCNRVLAPDSQCDFIGVSFFGTEELQYSLLAPRQGFSKRASGGSQDEPDCVPDAGGFRDVLTGFARLGKPLYITGSGIATDDDDKRVAYVESHLRAVTEVREQGPDIRGYFHHAFLDDFEWTSGYSRRYGLVHVDRRTLARTPNKSGFAARRLLDRPAARARKAAPT